MKFDVVAFLEEMYPTSMRRISDLTEKKLQAKLQHKVLVKITPTPSAVFTVFYCKFHAHVLYFLHSPVIFPAHALEICSITL